MRYVLIFALFCSAALMCGTPPSPYYQHDFAEQFPPPYHYPVNVDAVTPDGILVDTSGAAVSLTDIDRHVEAVESCLVTTFGIPPVIPADIIMAAQCDSNTFPLPVRTKDLEVKIADNWVWSCDHAMELIPVPSPDAGCLDKGLMPSADCPCYWRVGIQDNRTIVVTPNLYMLNDAVMRMVTGCNNVWVAPLAACAAPL